MSYLSMNLYWSFLFAVADDDYCYNYPHNYPHYCYNYPCYKSQVDKDLMYQHCNNLTHQDHLYNYSDIFYKITTQSDLGIVLRRIFYKIVDLLRFDIDHYHMSGKSHWFVLI